ncbi:MAG: tryptophan synthase subunit alpha [Actinomycetota bacterium]
MSMEAHLRARREAGARLLVPYVTGGLGPDWTDVVRAVADAGADAVEIGIPFSDPVMDGPTIQAASQQALDAGVTPTSILADARSLDVGIPIAVMTYCNLVFHAGCVRFAEALHDAGVDAAILPDLPLGEIEEWADAADEAGVETVMLAAPNTTDERLAAICARSRGFLYGVSLMGITGERSSLAESATVIARRAKAATDLPVLLGVGISSPEQAVEASTVADGVVVGSALVRRLLDGDGPDGAHALVSAFRRALDETDLG